MLIDALPSASATSATTPGRFGTETRSSVSSPPASSPSSSRRRSSRAPSFQAAIASPSAPASDRAHGAQPPHGVVDRVDQRVRVGEVDVAPDRGVRAGHARDVAEARAGRGELLALLGAAPARPARRARWRARAAGARRWRACGRACRRRAPRAARRGPTAAGAAARRACRGSSAVGVRYHVAPSNSSARAWRTPAFAAPASGCPPMKRSSSTDVDDGALGRADVGHDAVVARGVQRGAHGGGERPDGRGDERRLGAVERSGEIGRGAVDRADLQRRVEHAGRRVPARHLGAEPLARGEPDGPADQPDADDRDPHPAMIADRRRARFTQARSTAPCRRPPRRARPSRRTRRSRPRAAAAGRRRSPRPAPGAPRR